MRRTLILGISIILVLVLSNLVSFVPKIQTVKAQSGVSNSGIIAWWKLNEGSGTTVLDSSGNGYDGTIVGCTWVNNAGTSCLSFNGQTDYVNLPSLDLLNLNSVTVVAWINSDLTKVGFITYNGNGGEFEMGNGDLDQYAQSLNINSTYATFSVKLSDYNWYSVQSSFPIKPSTWHQIVGVWVKGVSLMVYVDGVLAGENDAIGALSLFDPGPSFTSSLGIYSQNQWGQQDFFKGQMSNVMIFSETLTAQEISALYASPTAFPTLSEPSVGAAPAVPSWSELNPSISPPARANEMMTYDPVDNVAVMFGGWNGPYLGDTWIYSFQNNTWIDKSPSGSPSPRERGGMVYATKHDEVILFGGYDGSEMINQTWTYSVEKNQWTQMFPAVAPPSTLNMVNLGMVYDSRDDVVIVFSDEGNTWAYNITANLWMNMKPSISPSPRTLSTNGEQMVYDASDDAVLLFGGTPTSFHNWLSAGGTYAFTAFNDTWAYYFENNTWVNLNPQLAPPARFNSQMVYDSVNDVVVLYGGAPGGQASLFGDTWIYNMTSNEWKNVTPPSSPPVRYASAMAFSPVEDETILFGGYNNLQETFYGDTWAFSYLGVPSSPSPSPTGPSPALTVSCVSSTSFAAFNIEINGNLTVNGAGLSGAPISIYYSIDGGHSWQDLTLVNTDSDGNFLVEWLPSVTGNYLINATYAGDSSYSSVSTVINLVIVPFTSQNAQDVFSVASNSTVTDLAFNSTSRELSFTVSGPSGTTGYVDAYIAKSLIEDISTLKVYLDGNQLNYSVTSQGDSWLIYFTYHHSTHEVIIDLNVAPAATTLSLTELLRGAAYGAMVSLSVIVVLLLFLRRGRNRIPP
jgi:hypothetical protein